MSISFLSNLIILDVRCMGLVPQRKGRDNASQSHRTNKCEFIKTSHIISLLFVSSVRQRCQLACLGDHIIKVMLKITHCHVNTYLKHKTLDNFTKAVIQAETLCQTRICNRILPLATNSPVPFDVQTASIVLHLGKNKTFGWSAHTSHTDLD